MAYKLPTKTFAGVRFVLIGFNPVDTQQVRGKLVSEGGVDAGQYGPNCTHVIVNNLVYYDPICAAARSDGKILVTDLWVDHSFDVSMPVDATNVMYRPVRELGGIPGAKSLVVCLTGYHGHARGDIATMVGLMGACFSKALVSTKVTHLICYKFEGDKYNSAKKWREIKIINHHWLEDCLRAWEILPEENYSKSGYELETMEPEDIARKQYEAQEMYVSPCSLPEDTATENTIPNQYHHEKQPQVKYRPRRDFGGIPGAKSLVVCLTGYRSRDRNDIMKMASRMGAKFSPSLTKKVTHLICYKFEGEKYKVAKRYQKIKLVNHHWLKDSLRAREILPEEYYNKSGYELETVEPEGGQGITRKQYEAREMDVSPCSLAEETPMADKVNYKPRRDFGGIPGAKSLVVSLTGYPHSDRNDIMKMVGQMGANFVVRLTKEVTHLICYKFKGDKYKFAQKKWGHIKLVNLQWLKDCLRAWEILPEENYNKSGYEIETGGGGARKRQKMEDDASRGGSDFLNETDIKRFSNLWQ